MNKDQAKGTAQNIRGRVKEAAGVVTGQKDLEADGATERVKGAVKKTVGDVKHGIANRLDAGSRDRHDDGGPDQHDKETKER